jgi:lysophospholipase L1-like esterase
MINKLKLLAIVIIALILLSGIALVIFQISGTKKSSSVLIRVACVGDSITFWTQYPNDLRMLLGSNYSLGNFGVGAATITVNAGKPYLNESVLQNAKEFKPDIVIIMVGTNDANPALKLNASNFVNDYVLLISKFQGLDSKPKVWIAKPPPIFNNGTGLSTENFDTYIIPAIEQVANQTNLSLIDVYTPLLNHPEYFKDGVHLNSEGSQVVANIIYNALILQLSSSLTPEG